MQTILSIVVGLFAFASLTHADIYQWEYINPADPSQGKRQSTTLAPDGAGVDAMPGAHLSSRNLNMAYLIGADLTNADGISTNLTDADLSYANLSNANFGSATLTGSNLSQAKLTNAYISFATLTDANFTGAEVRGANFNYGTGITLMQLYSTASYQAHDLSGIGLGGNNLAGVNLVSQNLTNANFFLATLTGANFTGAEIRGASFDRDGSPGTGITTAQLYSTASFQAHDLSGTSFWLNDLAGANFAGQTITDANFVGANLTGANFRQANLANAVFSHVSCPEIVCHGIRAGLIDADLTAADARGSDLFTLVPFRYLHDGNYAYRLVGEGAVATNLIRPEGRIDGLELDANALLVVRDYDGNPNLAPPIDPIPISVGQHVTMAPGGTLRIVFEADAWDSTISFAPGIPVTLGGTLELTFAANVNLASQVGRTFDLFDWTGITPTGTFAISSPYAWDISNLYTTGEVTLTEVPEPGSIALAAILPFSLTLYRRRKIS